MEEKMKLMVDPRYYGDAMRLSRKFLKITTPEAAAMLKMTAKQYKRCEIGRDIFPEYALSRLMNAAFSMLSYKSRK